MLMEDLRIGDRQGLEPEVSSPSGFRGLCAATDANTGFRATAGGPVRLSTRCAGAKSFCFQEDGKTHKADARDIERPRGELIAARRSVPIRQTILESHSVSALDLKESSWTLVRKGDYSLKWIVAARFAQ
jgi:hypothetical protein